MRWLSVVCLCVLAFQLASSYPVEDSQPSEGRETLSSLEDSIGKPTSEHSDREKRTIGVLRRIFPELSKESSRKRRAAELETAQSEKNEVRVPSNDLKAAASGDDNEDAESAEVSDEIDEAESGENTRSKRLGVFSNLFGGSSGASGSSSGGGSGGGSGAGSGNFLFDIIRRTADGAARAAGTVYRMVAGTESDSNLLQLPIPPAEPTPISATARSSPKVTVRQAPPAKDPTTLVAGSGATEQQDENANAPVAGDAGAAPAEDGYQAGIPGPITRLFVIANRGIANLIQDLILRLAQTSERIVNFKARLITAII